MDTLSSFVVHKPLNLLIIAALFMGFYAVCRITGLGEGRRPGLLLVPVVAGERYGIVDLKVVVHKLRKMIPGELVLVFDVDAGRVWLEGESSSKWRPSYGAGMFFAPFRRAAVFEAGVGRSVEKTFFMFLAQVKFLEF